MGWVADYTARIDPAALKAAGVVGVMRYVSRHAWKVASAAEVRELHAAGIMSLPNFEDEARGWMGGKSAGADDAAFAASAARTAGWPVGLPLPSSADFDMTAGEWTSAGRAYAVAYRDGLRARGYRPGVYGPWDVLSWCHGVGYDWFWQSMSIAFSGGRNGKPWTRANGAPADVHLRQRRQTTVAGSSVDYNDIVRSDWSGLDMAQLDDIQKTLEWVNRRVEAFGRGYPTMHGGAPQLGEAVWLVEQVKALAEKSPVAVDAAAVAAILAKDPGFAAAVGAAAGAELARRMGNG